MVKKKIKIKKSECDFDLAKVLDITRADVFDDYIEIEFEIGE